MQTIKRERRRYHKDAAPADDIITLIHLVRQNPALYNYKLQPNQRRRVDVLNGWAQIAAQIGNKYSVEECRRKWKNLRDTYHQYRLRKPKFGNGLSKWRYAKELDFLSNIYQPKLKSHRHNYESTHDDNLLQDVKSLTQSQQQPDDIVQHTNITLVNEDDGTFILTSYDEHVSDDVTTIDHGSNIELPHHTVIHGVEIVKNEHATSLDDDGATSAEVDYEEVCLYEESANPPNVGTETIIGAGNTSPTNSKAFQYIDTNDFGIASINGNTQLSNSSSSIIGSSTKLKNIPSPTDIVTTIPVSTESDADPSMPSLNSLQFEFAPSKRTREELDLFFDFLKKKMQRFPCEEITSIQVEFLNCVLRREAELFQKSITE